jgi:LmbE family N-acetylglucosaminyl deacetylase
MAASRDSRFYKSAIVVAHPDDEILWFSSILDKVDAIVFCFLDYTPAPALGNGRRGVIAEYPFANLSCLNITEAGSFDGANWKAPEETEFGLGIASNKALAERYQANFHRLQEKLAAMLSGYENVYTHNPWGEYGHEDHVQIFRVVKAIRRLHGFNLWFSNYGSDRASNLMLKYLSGYHSNYVSYPTNIELASRIAALYKKHKCWTWYGNYQWFREESFMNEADLTHTRDECGHLFPINFIRVNCSGNASSPGTRSFIKKLTRKIKSIRKHITD